MKKVLLYLSIIGIIALSASWSFIWHNSLVGRKVCYDIPRNIAYRFTIKNQSNRMVREAKFHAFAPIKKTGTQHCFHLETSYPHQILSDEFGNRMLSFVFPLLAPYSTKVLTVKAQLRLASEPNQVGREESDQYLHPGTYVESNHPDIIKVARELKDPGAEMTAEKIFQWVRRHIQYTGYSRKVRGAMYAFREKRGDCTEFSCLFAALCRACEIPSRVLAGFVCNEDRVLKSTDYHNWAEYYDNGSWYAVDPQKGVFRADTARYVAMRIVRDKENSSVTPFDRFRCEGEGLKVKME